MATTIAQVGSKFGYETIEVEDHGPVGGIKITAVSPNTDMFSGRDQCVVLWLTREQAQQFARDIQEAVR